MKKRNFVLLMLAVLVIIAVCIVAFFTKKEDKNASGGKTIVTSFYPMYVATLNITDGVDGVTVKNMSEPQTGCLHDYQMTPDDMKLLSKADIFVSNGAGMESFIDDIVKEYKDLKIITATSNLDLISEDGEEEEHDHDHDADKDSSKASSGNDNTSVTEKTVDDKHEYGGTQASSESDARTYSATENENGIVYESGDDVHEYDSQFGGTQASSGTDANSDSKDTDSKSTGSHTSTEADDHDHDHDHDHGSQNAHAWMSVSLYRKMVKNIADELAKADPDHADAYRKNAAAYDEKLAELEKKEQEVAQKLAGQNVIIFHEAYAYLAKDLSVPVVYTMDLDEQRQVSAGEVADTVSAIKEHQVKYIFAEKTYASEMGATVEAESNVKVLYLNPLTRASEDGKGSDKDQYITEMEKNFELILKELS